MENLNMSLHAALEAGHLTQMVDGKIYDKSGLRISFAKNYSTGYFNVSFVEGHDGSGIPVFRSNVRVDDEDGCSSHVHHLCTSATLWEAAWIANNFMANYKINIRKWKQLNNLKSYGWKHEGEIPKQVNAMFDPQTCRDIRGNVDAASKARREKSKKAQETRRAEEQARENLLKEVRENEIMISRLRQRNEELQRACI